MNKYDSMIACNKKASEEKVNRAVTEIRMVLQKQKRLLLQQVISHLHTMVIL